VRVDWAILSRYAEGSAGVATIVGAGIDTFYSLTFPVPIQAALTVQLRGQPDELGETHEISLRVLDANLELVGEPATISFEAEPNPDLEDGWEAGVLVAVNNQFVAETAGTYSIEIDVDGSHAKSVPFRILEQPEE
jgi:hypothetical protein